MSSKVKKVWNAKAELGEEDAFEKNHSRSINPFLKEATDKKMIYCDELSRFCSEAVLLVFTQIYFRHQRNARLRLEKLAQPSCQALDEFFESIDHHLSLTMNQTIN